jgi:tetratricopeptide (TPR) repeat protein
MIRFALLIALPSLLAAQAPEELFRQQKYDDARAAFQAQLTRNKGDGNALFYMGRIAMAQEKWSDATDWFEKAVKANDTSAAYHYWLGASVGEQATRASKLKQPFMARRIKSEFERAVQLDRTMVEPRMGLMDFYSMAPGVMGGSMDKAREQAAEVAKLNKLQGHRAAARLANRQKDVATVEREYRAVIAEFPDSVHGYNWLAGFLRSQSPPRNEEALGVYDQMMKARPNDAAPHANFGIVSAISGLQLDRGERELKYWFEHRPQNTTTMLLSGVRFRLGQIYEKTARSELAKAEYNEALKLNPKNEDARKALAALK